MFNSSIKNTELKSKMNSGNKQFKEKCSQKKEEKLGNIQNGVGAWIDINVWT